MTDNTTKAPDAQPAKLSRDQSTIQFPYGDLDDAVSVADGLMRIGGVPCDADQLAAALNQVPTSGNFRLKVATARIFGVIETVQGKYQLTDLGFAIVDKQRERAAKVEAFLKVPLYRRVYDEFRNKQLPPRPLPLEHAFVGFGVATKQKDRARQAFDRSAQQAGFFDTGGRDRLIRPPVAGISATADTVEDSPATEREEAVERSNGAGGGYGSSGGRRPPSGLHPFIQGLLETLPEPETNWTVEGRAKWLQAAANIFDLIYKGDGTISVKASSPSERQ